MRALLLFLAACGAPMAFSVDPSFSSAQDVEIARAASAWNAHVKPDHRITLTGGQWIVYRRETPGGWNGSCSRSEKWIAIRGEPIGATTYAVALHEFGHALNLAHTPTGLMMPFTVSEEFTPEVLEECRKAGACK